MEGEAGADATMVPLIAMAFAWNRRCGKVVPGVGQSGVGVARVSLRRVKVRLSWGFKAISAAPLRSAKITCFASVRCRFEHAFDDVPGVWHRACWSARSSIPSNSSTLVSVPSGRVCVICFGLFLVVQPPLLWGCPILISVWWVDERKNRWFFGCFAKS